MPNFSKTVEFLKISCEDHMTAAESFISANTSGGSFSKSQKDLIILEAEMTAGRIGT